MDHRSEFAKTKPEDLTLTIGVDPDEMPLYAYVFFLQLLVLWRDVFKY